MRVSRLFVEIPLETGTLVELDEISGHYLKTVLRVRSGFKVILFNGDGFDYEGCIKILSRNQTAVEITTKTFKATESSLKIHLGLGISKGDRMDYAIQKAVELGVYRVVPLLTEHCVVRLEGTKTEHRQQHWQRIARSACEQSGRSTVPTIDSPQELADWLKDAPGLKVYLDPRETRALKMLPIPSSSGLSVLVGPEGGLSIQERGRALSHGFLGVQLGPRILRNETAAMAILAAAQSLWGDWG